MRIGIEAQRIFRQNKHGMDFVILEEIHQLQKMDSENDYYVFVKPGPDRCVSDSENVHVVELECPSYPLWEQWALPRAAKKYSVDLLHCTSNTAPIFCNIRLILTLHDIIFLEPRENRSKSMYQNIGWLYRRFVVPRILKKCKKIITVSKFEYDRIKKRLNISENVLTYIYNGYNKRFRPIDDTKEVIKKYIDESGYFMFLGNTDPKKNTVRTIRAYGNYLKQSGIKRKLLVIDLSEEYIHALLKDNDLEDIKNHIVSHKYILNSELPYLYNGAFAFLYTSQRESFGIPLLEAMACGTPVITSDTSSMPEIAGEKAVMINPEREADITEKMLMLEMDEQLYAEQKTYGMERAKLFSWEKTAESLMGIYQEMNKKINNEDHTR
jgi:glycosyltransferase involved in cell wall biosynthesis